MRFLRSLGLLSLFAVAITLSFGCSEEKKEGDKKDDKSDKTSQVENGTSSGKVAKTDSPSTSNVSVKFSVEGMT